MQLPSQITAVDHAAHSALQLTTRHGKLLVSLQGAQVLSWRPSGQRDVFWLSPTCLPEPAAIRGGVPVCWPWFAKQGQASTAVQHGPVRNMAWRISSVHSSSDDEVSVSFEPVSQLQGDLAAAGVPQGLHVSLRITLGASLLQSLQTHNRGRAAFELSQALHSYYAVSHAQHVAIEGIQGLRYTDRLRALTQDLQRTPFVLNDACDRTYEQPLETADLRMHRYTLADSRWQRRIDIDAVGSRSVVVWNPGGDNARNMSDLPNESWPDFMCIEAANAGPDVIHLQPGESHTLTQHLRLTVTP